MLKSIREIRYHIDILNAGEILRRYFVMNSFDGILTALGVLLGLFFSGNLNPQMIIFIIIATGTSMFISGFFGAYMSEKAEREKDIKKLERALLKKLDKSIIEESKKTIIFLTALVDGVSPLIVGILVIVPFFFPVNPLTAFRISLFIAFVVLFSLGLFLGKISKMNLLLSGVKMLLVGVLAVILISMLQLVNV